MEIKKQNQLKKLLSMSTLESFLMSFIILIITLAAPVILLGIAVVVGFTIKDMWDKLNSFFDF